MINEKILINGIDYLSESPFTIEPIKLIGDEQTAIDIVLNVLKENNVNVSAIHLERTAQYIKIVANKISCFCHLKPTGKSQYIDLTISLRDSKILKSDQRFTNIVIGKKRFSRIPITYFSDIASYADVILLAYKWGTTVSTPKFALSE